MLPKELQILLKQMENYEISGNKIEIIKKELKGNYRTQKNTITNVKTHWVGSIVEWKRQDKICEFENRSIECNRYEQQRT